MREQRFDSSKLRRSSLGVDHIDYQETKCNHLLQGTANASLPLSMSCIECLVSGLEDYVLEHEKLVEEEYQNCSVRREDLKVGIGQVNSIENSRGTGQIVEVVIMIANMASEPCCWRANSSMTQIQAFVPDLSKSIAGLILSSDDLEFQGECAALLGLEAVDSGAEERIESCIKEKIIGIVEMNDRRPKGESDNGQHLFECESLGREDDEDELAQEDLSTLDF